MHSSNITIHYSTSDTLIHSAVRLGQHTRDTCISAPVKSRSLARKPNTHPSPTDRLPPAKTNKSFADDRASKEERVPKHVLRPKGRPLASLTSKAIRLLGTSVLAHRPHGFPWTKFKGIRNPLRSDR